MITVELDPRLKLPPVVGVEHGQTEYQSLTDYEYASATEVSIDDLQITDQPGAAPSGIQPPEGVVVLSQSSRMTDSGQIVVDVLLDILDVPGAKEYEIRTAVG